MTVRYIGGWDIAKVGGLTLSGVDDGGNFNVSLTTGTYCHENISAAVRSYDPLQSLWNPTSLYSKFATYLGAQMTAASIGAGTYTVTWTASGSYNIAYSAGNWSTTTFTSSTPSAVLMRRILGFTAANKSGAANYDSNATPWFFIAAALGARSSWDRYDADVVTVEDDDAADPYHSSATESAQFWDWTQVYEPRAAVYDLDVAAGLAVPYTWQQFFRHHRRGNPFALTDDSYTFSGASVAYTVHKLTKEGCKHAPQTPGGDNNYQAYFDQRLLTYWMGYG